jgi:hypothetical protein
MNTDLTWTARGGFAPRLCLASTAAYGACTRPPGHAPRHADALGYEFDLPEETAAARDHADLGSPDWTEADCAAQGHTPADHIDPSEVAPAPAPAPPPLMTRPDRPTPPLMTPPITAFAWSVDAPEVAADAIYVVTSHGPEGAWPMFASRSRSAAVEAAVTEAMTNAGADGQAVQALLAEADEWSSDDAMFTVAITQLPLT